MIGQQQTMTVAAAVEKGGGTLLRHTMLVLLVAALMAAMVAVSALPAFADSQRRANPPTSNANHGCRGQLNTPSNPIFFCNA